jgi:hypothetical protein
MFYGLKQNGRPFFINKTNNQPTPYYSIIVNNERNRTLEATGTIIKSSNAQNYGKEYFLTLSKLQCNVELFDLEKDEVYVKTLPDFTSLSSVWSMYGLYIIHFLLFQILIQTIIIFLDLFLTIMRKEKYIYKNIFLI